MTVYKPIDELASVTATNAPNLLNVRMGPGAEFPIINQVTRGTIITIRDERSGWYEIQLPTGYFGWVSKLYVTVSHT